MTAMDRLERVVNFPLHKSLGITSINSSEGKGSFEIIVSDSNANPNGIFHGGVISFLCDVCSYSALLSVLPEDKEAVTHDMHVSMLRAASFGDIVVFSAEVLKKGRTVCFVKVEAKVGSKIIATATVTKSLINS